MRFQFWFYARLVLMSALLVASFNAKGFEQDEELIKLGVISLAPPSKIFKQWQPFADYLSERLNRKVEIVIPRGFKKIKSAIENKEMDIFFINSLIYYRLKQAGKAVPVAQMQNIEGSNLSQSVLFVRSDSDIDSLRDLKGKKVAFVSPMGAGGYLAPRATFYKQGIKTKTQTQEQFTKNLSSSIHKVLLGDVKVGTMCAINYQLMSKRLDMGDLRIIEASENYPEGMIGASPELAKNIRRKIADILIRMYDDNEGGKILSAMKDMKIKKFIAYDSKVEKLTQSLIKSAEFKIN